MPRYTVTGSQPVLDHQPGESFDADLPADQEKFLLGIGALEFSEVESVREPWDAEKTENEYDALVKTLNVESHKRR